VNATAGEFAPRATRVGRLRVYLNRTFPPLVTGPYFVIYALGCYLGLDALAGHAPVRVGWQIACGAISSCLFGFLLRVWDDLKDTAADIRLAASGDARYRERPAVTGEVRMEDLRWFGIVLSVSLLALNLPFVNTVAFPVFLVTYLIWWLSARWFFWPRISRSLLLALITHNPMLLLLLGYVLALYVGIHGVSGLKIEVVYLLLGLWWPWTAWETSRKIRIPEDETAYETYSQIFGRAAPLVPAAFVIGSSVSLSLYAQAISLPWIYPAVLAGTACVVLLACLRFLVRPSRRNAALRPWVDLYTLVANVGLLAALISSRGISFA
jgi:hypothetical protein